MSDAADHLLFYSWFATKSRYGLKMAETFGRDGVGVNDGHTLAGQLRAMPAGHRVAYINAGDIVLFRDRDDLIGAGDTTLTHPFGLSRATAGYLAMFGAMRRDFAAINPSLTLDGFVWDAEDGPQFWSGDAAALAKHPSYGGLVRRWGFPPLVPGADGEAWINAFNAACGRVAACEFEALISALHRHFPQAWWMNWADTPITPADAALVPEMNGHAAYRDADHAPFYSPVWYGPGSGLKRTAGGELGRGGEAVTSWQGLVWCRNQAAAAMRADPLGGIRAWTCAPAKSTFAAAHCGEIRHHALYCGLGAAMHWAGDSLTAAQQAADDQLWDQVGDEFIHNTAGAQLVKTAGLSALVKDTLGYLVSAAYDGQDNLYGRVSWPDDAAAGRAVTVAIEEKLTVPVTRTGSEAGTSFVVKKA